MAAAEPKPKRGNPAWVKGMASPNPKGRLPREREQSFREVLLSALTLEDWEKIVIKAASQAKRGDATARRWLSDYIIGPPTQRQEISGDDGNAIKVIIERVSVTPADALPVADDAEGAE